MKNRRPPSSPMSPPTPERMNGAVVLEEGVGRISEIHVVAPVVQDDGSIVLQVAKGGVFSYYEFPWPANDRLTDEKWREMLDGGQAPALPGWTNSFRVEQGEYADLQLGVFNFQKNITGYLLGCCLCRPGLKRTHERFPERAGSPAYQQAVRRSPADPLAVHLFRSAVGYHRGGHHPRNLGR